MTKLEELLKDSEYKMPTIYSIVLMYTQLLLQMMWILWRIMAAHLSCTVQWLSMRSVWQFSFAMVHLLLPRTTTARLHCTGLL